MNNILSSILSYLEDIYQNIEIIHNIVVKIREIWKKLSSVFILFYFLLICIQFKIIRRFIIKHTNYDKVVIFLYSHTNLFVFMILSTLVIWYIYKIWKYSKRIIDNQKYHATFIENFHIIFLHDIRDNIKELDLITFKPNDVDYNKYIKNKMFQELVNNLQPYVDFLANHLTEYCNSTISVCIKLVKYDTNFAMTINRSKNTRQDRQKENEDVNINNNDDFKFLVNGRATFYGKSNLKDEYENDKYNVGDDYKIWSKKYNSTLIVPIRYYSKKSNHNNVNVDFDIVGFLCIDSKDNIADWENNNSYELNLLASFADTMYIYIKKYRDLYYLYDSED